MIEVLTLQGESAGPPSASDVIIPPEYFRGARELIGRAAAQATRVQFTAELDRTYAVHGHYSLDPASIEAHVASARRSSQDASRRHAGLLTALMAIPATPASGPLRFTGNLAPIVAEALKDGLHEAAIAEHPFRWWKRKAFVAQHLGELALGVSEYSQFVSGFGGATMGEASQDLALLTAEC